MRERILVTDVEERAALAVCRGLAAVAYRVSGVASSRSAAGHWSRTVARRYTLPSPRLDPAGFVAELAAITAEGEHAVLIPSVDAALLAVSEHREAFAPHVRVGLPPHDIVLRNLDKLALFDAAERVGLPPPAGETCKDVDQAAAVARRYGYPVILKPVRSLARGEGRTITSAFAADEDELRRLAPEHRAPFTVQRREPGAVVSCGGVVANGALLGLCVSRYERTWPRTAGSASSSTTIEPPHGLPHRIEQLLGEIGWQGIFELELIETADGRLAAIDFNPRPYGSLTLATAAGANLPAIWCDWLLDRPPVPARCRAGLRYRWEEAELLNLAWAIRNRRLAAAAAVLRPRRSVFAFFRLADPGPVVARSLAALRQRVARRAGSAAST
jgi:predicted ATP-grasp superfamily ATP-dependent carboligase